MPQRPLNVGLIGGGGGAFIVQPHQRAIFFDGTRRVTAAALHPDPDGGPEGGRRRGRIRFKGIAATTR